MRVQELMNTDCGTIIEELVEMDFKELQKANRGLTVIQNAVSDLMADKILKEEEDTR